MLFPYPTLCYVGSGVMVLTDEQWAVLEPLVEQVKPKGKTPLRHLRRTLEAIIWRCSNGAKWLGDPRRTRPLVGGNTNLHPLEQARCLAAAPRVGAGAGRATRHGVPRRHQHPRAPQGCRRGQKGGTSSERDMREALGRSRGGFGTKVCVVAEGGGRAIAFAIAPGQAHELPMAPDLLSRLPDVPRWVVGDKGYSSSDFREMIWNGGSRPAIPTRSNEAS